MNERSRFESDVARRVATIQGQLKGIERLLEKRDVPQAITQSAAVRNALESVVRTILQACIVGRYATVSMGESADGVFERALERAMTYWFSPNVGDTAACRGGGDEAQFWVAARHYTAAVQNRLSDIEIVLKGDDYLHALRELGAAVREVDELMKLALCRFVKDRTSGRHSPSKVKEAFEHAVSDALKYWHIPDPGIPESVTGELSRKILVVDDDPDVVDYLTHVLRKHGYGVVSAADAEQAMAKVETENPDLIILDIMMPKGTEGFQFAWKLRGRAEPKHRNIPIIVLTSIHETTRMRFYPDQSDGYYGPGEYLPVEGFIDKPVGEEDLVRQVELVLKRAKRDTGGSG